MNKVLATLRTFKASLVMVLISIVIFIALLSYGSIKEAYYSIKDRISSIIHPEFRLPETKLIIENSKQISELFTYARYSEMICDTLRRDSIQDENFLGWTELKVKEGRLVAILKGTAYASLDIAKIKVEELHIDGKKSCCIYLPHAQISDVIINPKDRYLMSTPEELGIWNEHYEDMLNVYDIYKEKLKNKLKEEGLIEMAEDNGREVLTLFLKGLGYHKVKVVFEDRKVEKFNKGQKNKNEFQ